MAKIKHWLVNIFWYHYKLHFFGALLLAYLGFSFVANVLLKPADDFILVFAANHYIAHRDVLPVQNTVSEALRTDDNGKAANVSVLVLHLNENELSFQTDLVKLLNTGGSRLPVLYIMDAEIYGRYMERLNLEMAVGHPLDLRDTDLFRSAGLHSHSYYACIQKPDPRRADNIRVQELWAVNAIRSGTPP
jgi:hypothetical protein